MDPEDLINYRSLLSFNLCSDTPRGESDNDGTKILIIDNNGKAKNYDINENQLSSNLIITEKNKMLSSSEGNDVNINFM